MRRIPLSIELVTRVERLTELTREWEELLARSRSPEPVLGPIWVLSWWSVFGDQKGRTLCSLAMRDGERLVGLALFSTRSHRHLGVLPFRRVEMLCSGEDEADEICSEYLGVIAERGREDDVARALAAQLTALGRVDELVIPAMRGDDPMTEVLAGALREGGFDVVVSETARSPFVALPATFDAYLRALPSSHRYVVRRSLRDFDAWARGTAQLHAAATRDELAEGAAILARLHGERWERRRPEGVFGSRRFCAFHEKVMPALFDRGALQLLWLSAHGEPVAAIYNVVSGGKVYFYQAGRKLDLPREIRVGHVLHAHAIRRAIEAGLSEYDFLAGASRYKRELATGARPVVTLRAARRSVRERVRRAGVRGLELARRAGRAAAERVRT